MYMYYVPLVQMLDMINKAGILFVARSHFLKEHGL